VEPGDRAAWEPLWEGYNRFYGRRLPAEITTVTWARFFDPREPVHALVAEGEGRLLGIAHYLFHRSTIHVGPTCYLQDLFTDESARGRGIGRALIAAVSDGAREGGAARLYWQTHETNVQAMRLYDAVAQRSGFVVYRLAL
jgi:GNAT superfamily N-acetyltransferase